MNKPQEVTKDELIMVKYRIIYPVILDVLERDIGKMKLIDLKIPTIYIGNLKHLQNLITQELTEIKREMHKRGIKIFNQERSTKGITAKYLCRGYSHEISFLPNIIRACVIIKVCMLLNLDINGEVI
ncbi:MAG: hypothetical protein JWM44_2472 [Bacilli bacterium]|jgi:Cu2+-containing amine oxidase|nr:hypothetical protein [Bacilli bacterium]